jgi:hypothetical protein
MEAFQALTGAPCSMIDNESLSVNELWTYISESDKH